MYIVEEEDMGMQERQGLVDFPTTKMISHCVCMTYGTYSIITDKIKIPMQRVQNMSTFYEVFLISVKKKENNLLVVLLPIALDAVTEMQVCLFAMTIYFLW